jgi:hypothetical protein
MEQECKSPLTFGDVDLVPQHMDRISLLEKARHVFAMLFGRCGNRLLSLRCDSAGRLEVRPPALDRAERFHHDVGGAFISGHTVSLDGWYDYIEVMYKGTSGYIQILDDSDTVLRDVYTPYTSDDLSDYNIIVFRSWGRGYKVRLVEFAQAPNQDCHITAYRW